MKEVKAFSTKTSAAKLSVTSNSLLVVAKIAAGIITGSVSILAEAIHSLLDLAAAVIAFLSVRISDKPADAGHPFGHGKVENVSGIIEAILIIIAGIWIIYEAVQRIITRTAIQLAGVGIGVMALAIVINILVSRKLHKVSQATDSPALEADAWHLSTDVYTSVAVLVSLLIIHFTGFILLDPIIAIIVAVVIMRTGYQLTRKSFGVLVDERLPASEEAIITEVIKEHCNKVVGFHSLRTRKAGSQRQIDFHLVMAKNASLESVHQMCDHLEEDIKTKLPQATINIHVEPCQMECNQCGIQNCSLRRKSKS